MIIVHHICGHQSEVDKVTFGNDVPDGYIALSADKPCPECQSKIQSNINGG